MGLSALLELLYAIRKSVTNHINLNTFISLATAKNA